MRKYILNTSFSILIALFISNCSSSTDSKNGTLRVLLTDAPASYESVNVIFSEISAHIDSAWVNVMVDPTNIDLLQYSNGETFLLASEDIDPGHYTQIRLKIDSAYVVKDGMMHELSVPSGAKTGLKFGPQFTINEGSTYTLVIDFDASKSVKRNGQGYTLHPHIRVIAQAGSGSISGTILNPTAMPVASAITGIDTVSTFVDVSNGDFMLPFLPEGAYTVTVEDTNGLAFSQNAVMVNAGQDNDLGDISLQ